jgi:hypothetical protein
MTSSYNQQINTNLADQNLSLKFLTTIMPSEASWSSTTQWPDSSQHKPVSEAAFIAFKSFDIRKISQQWCCHQCVIEKFAVHNSSVRLVEETQLLGFFSSSLNYIWRQLTKHKWSEFVQLLDMELQSRKKTLNPHLPICKFSNSVLIY